MSLSKRAIHEMRYDLESPCALGLAVAFDREWNDRVFVQEVNVRDVRGQWAI